MRVEMATEGGFPTMRWPMRVESASDSVVSDLLLGLRRLVRGRLESVVPGAWSGIVLRV